MGNSGESQCANRTDSVWRGACNCEHCFALSLALTVKRGVGMHEAAMHGAAFLRRNGRGTVRLWQPVSAFVARSAYRVTRVSPKARPGITA